MLLAQLTGSGAQQGAQERCGEKQVLNTSEEEAKGKTGV